MKPKPLVHLLPAWREKTYCGLDPLDRSRGRIKTTDVRGKVTCEDCKGLPKE